MLTLKYKNKIQTNIYSVTESQISFSEACGAPHAVVPLC